MKSWVVVACVFLNMAGAASAQSLTSCRSGTTLIISGGSESAGLECTGEKGKASVIGWKASTAGPAGHTIPAPGSASTGSGSAAMVSKLDQQKRDLDRKGILRTELSRENVALQSIEGIRAKLPQEYERRRKDHLANISALERELKGG